MSVVVVASASGAPGVTALSLALASAWPGRAVLVEADLTGGDLVCRFDGLDTARGLVALAANYRRGIDASMIEANIQEVELATGDGGLAVIAGPTDSTTAAVIAPAFEAIISGLGEAHDVIVDAGRLAPALIGAQEPIVATADIVLVVARPDLSGALHARSLVDWLVAKGARPMLVLVGTGFRPSEVSAAVGVEVVATITDLGVASPSPTRNRTARIPLVSRVARGARRSATPAGIDELALAVSSACESLRLAAGSCEGERADMGRSDMERAVTLSAELEAIAPSEVGRRRESASGRREHSTTPKVLASSAAPGAR